MLKKWLLLLALPLVLLQAVQAQDALTSKYLDIRKKLIDLRTSSVIVTKQLETLSEQLSQSQQEVEQWKEHSTNLSDSLMNINKQLSECYLTMERQQVRLNEQRKGLTILLIVIIARTLLMIAGYILYAKGVKMPRWLDILL